MFIMRTLYGFFCVFLVGSALGQCPSNWIRHADSCYHFSHDIENWADSMILCKAFDAHLVEINDAVENSFIRNNMIADYCWIGLTDLSEEGVWRWMHSQTKPDYTNWAPNEPNNIGTNENCVYIYKTLTGWNDAACKADSHYICERNIGEVSVVG